MHEDEHLEFKEAKEHFDFEKLVKYCCALANEGGGKVILGVTDKKPRTVLGSNAFENLDRTKDGLKGKTKGGRWYPRPTLLDAILYFSATYFYFIHPGFFGQL